MADVFLFARGFPRFTIDVVGCNAPFSELQDQFVNRNVRLFLRGYGHGSLVALESCQQPIVFAFALTRTECAGQHDALA